MGIGVYCAVVYAFDLKVPGRSPLDSSRALSARNMFGRKVLPLSEDASHLPAYRSQLQKLAQGAWLPGFLKSAWATFQSDFISLYI